MIRATRGRSMDGWMDGWMDGVDLIICLAIWTLYKRWGPLISDEPRAICIASRNKLRSTSLPGRISEDFGRISGGFGRPKWRPKSIFARFFSKFFSNAFSHRFWVNFWRLETWKIAIFLKENNDFYKIDVFEKASTNHRFWSRFRRPKPRKIEKKEFWKTCIFSTSIFLCFLVKIFDFGSILGVPGLSNYLSKEP